MKVSIRLKLITAIITMVVIPMQTFSLSACQRIHPGARERIESELTSISDEAEGILKTFFEASYIDQRNIENNTEFNESLITGEFFNTVTLFGNLKDERPEFIHDIVYVDNAGICRASTFPENIENIFTNADWFIDAIVNTDPNDIIVGYDREEVHEDVMVVLAGPIIKEGVQYGVLAQFIKPAYLTQLLSDMRLGETGETYIVALNNGYFITESRFLADLKRGGLVEETSVFEINISSLESYRRGVELADEIEDSAGDDRLRILGEWKNYLNMDVIGVVVSLPRYNMLLVTEVDKNEVY